MTTIHYRNDVRNSGIDARALKSAMRESGVQLPVARKERVSVTSSRA